MKTLAQGVILVMLAVATACVVGALAIKQFIWAEGVNEWDSLQAENEARRSSGLQ